MNKSILMDYKKHIDQSPDFEDQILQVVMRRSLAENQNCDIDEDASVLSRYQRLQDASRVGRFDDCFGDLNNTITRSRPRYVRRPGKRHYRTTDGKGSND